MRPLSLKTYQDFFHSPTSTRLQDVIVSLNTRVNNSLSLFGGGSADIYLRDIALLQLTEVLRQFCDIFVTILTETTPMSTKKDLAQIILALLNANKATSDQPHYH
ncbi:MAG: hypothetical protein A3E82_02325 [Gammaproteobacteria bacterium RIFCSPHIGHO2_12_FULL_38_11]|nr:MAG: hypothetical protein A3E82_02325 [Gammaproteobacteria bacterium RIFCSPHIGHO2_12_FULL_38_11]